MILTLKRMSDNGDATIGALFFNGDVTSRLDCFTVEDQAQTKKVYGETRIPAGVYAIKLRREGGMVVRYDKKFSYIGHDGMLWIQNVPNFKYVYIHLGNNDDHSEGCILVNDTIHSNHTGSSSKKAYEKLYPLIKDALKKGEDVYIEVIDE